MTTVNVRYIVRDVEEVITFYTEHLGFEVQMPPGPGFARLARGDLRLLLNAVGGSGGAAQAMPDGRRPEPGGWNRIQIEVEDIDATVGKLKSSGVHFRNDIVTGNGGNKSSSTTPPATPSNSSSRRED